MIINISRRPTVESMEFANAYLNEEWNESPELYALLPGQQTKLGLGPDFLYDLNEGNLDKIDHDIKLDSFSWRNYLILQRYINKYANANANPIQRMSNELGGIDPAKFNTMRKKSRKGGKKRRVRARRSLKKSTKKSP